ncbi:hypothetical protein V8J88_13700 [Massilia sp. W12]|uniref:hypothetical protein n=1 Tax=Massilia sp. W12 TaxID=3126507 RepID=UPI0030D3B965
MQNPAFTVKCFGAYAMATGLILLFVPNLLLGLFGIATTQEIWVHVLGVIAFILGFYYWACASAGVHAFFRASVVGRTLFFVMCGLLITFWQAPWQLILFGAVDLAGALWTARALRRQEARS